ncbi:hypothetical protein INQ51_21110 [Maribellus sp. CM-23]|uniref:VPS10 domain-containing protein n=1 Tax=Maribellus sp. CM-23 TaxID=2781026 RepID=UPI001F1AA288|nr:hypothetical protein [Maribellus sp. CM-23]MCE4566835.1 hypothetical protein [Maribellus sp. CM-23]
MIRQLLPILLCLLFLSGQLTAQQIIEKTPAKEREKWYGEFLKMKEASDYRQLSWQFIGPTNISGRMTDVEVVQPKGKSYTIYVAGASGGIWKTENEGVTWIPVFEHGMSTAFGDIALDPQNQETIWAGTGEANIFRSSNAGAGIYVSKDGGKTWAHKGLTNTNTIARILVDPNNSEVVYVAAGGNEWTNDKERGVYKTTDGGTSWKKILYVDEMTGAYDLVMDPNDPNTIYASMWQRIRKKWNDPRTEADYKNTGLYKTTDGGKNWKEINTGLPQPNQRGRIGIDLCRAQPNTLYAFVDNYEKLAEDHSLNQEEDAYGRPSSGRIKGATVYRSDDAGENWRQVSEQSEYMEGMSGTYGWVFGQVRVDPVNPDKVYAMGLFLNVSEDGGKTYRRIGNMHMDHHGLWIDPDNTNYLVNVNDGGVAISYDGENFRTFYDNLPLVQFYNVGMDNSNPFHVYGSIQDHFSYRGVVDLRRGRDRIPAVEFESTPGGEGSIHVVNPKNPDILYSSGFYGTITRSVLSTGESKEIMPPVPEGVDKLRGQWLAPFVLSSHNTGIIYHGTQFVHRSMDEGETWERISPDLTYNDPDKKGDIPYQTIFTISESPLKFGVLYAGTDDGRVWMTLNSGENWEEINKGLPFRKWVSHMEASRYAPGRVYMTQNGKRDDDFAAYLWKSEDYGKTWENIQNNLPYGPVNVIREDPKNENILYVGTDYGVFVSSDRGKSWQTLVGDLPTTYVHDINIHQRDDIAVIATHGRGMWALDVRIMREVAKAATEDVAAKILEIPEVYTPRGRRYWRNAPGLKIPFYLKKGEPVTTIVSDTEGKVIFNESQNAGKGLNYVNWNLQNHDKEFVEAGEYVVKIAGPGFEKEKKLEVKEFRRR